MPMDRIHCAHKPIDQTQGQPPVLWSETEPAESVGPHVRVFTESESVLEVRTRFAQIRLLLPVKPRKRLRSTGVSVGDLRLNRGTEEGQREHPWRGHPCDGEKRESKNAYERWSFIKISKPRDGTQLIIGLLFEKNSVTNQRLTSLVFHP